MRHHKPDDPEIQVLVPRTRIRLHHAEVWKRKSARMLHVSGRTLQFPAHTEQQLLHAAEYVSATEQELRLNTLNAGRVEVRGVSRIRRRADNNGTAKHRLSRDVH